MKCTIKLKHNLEIKISKDSFTEKHRTLLGEILKDLKNYMMLID